MPWGRTGGRTLVRDPAIEFLRKGLKFVTRPKAGFHVTKSDLVIIRDHTGHQHARRVALGQIQSG